MRGNKPIECSRPQYRRKLLAAGLGFSARLCANPFTLGHLAFRDLGARMRAEAISKASARALELARKLADEGQIDLIRVQERITTISEHVNQILTGEHYVRTVTIYDAAGRFVQSWTERGGKIFPSEPGFHEPDASGGYKDMGGEAAEGPPTPRVRTAESGE